MARAGSRLALLAAYACIVGVVSVRHKGGDLVPWRRPERSSKGNRHKFNRTLAFFDGRLHLLKDLGYMAWHTNCSVDDQPHKFAGDVGFEEMQCGLGANGSLQFSDVKPRRLQDLNKLRASLPRKLPFGRHEKPMGYAYKPPYEVPSVAAPFVASQRFDFSKIDFIVGGGLLETLATGDFVGRDYTVQRFRGAVMIRGYTAEPHFVDLKSQGFQVERLLTGRRMDEIDTHETIIQHLQVLRIGKFNVLVVSKVDAADQHGRLVEITSVFAPHWRKIVFQMLAKGSTTLVRGIVQEQGSDLSVHELGEYDLRDIIDWTLVRGIVQEQGSDLSVHELGEYDLRDIIEWSTTRLERRHLASSLINALKSIQAHVFDKDEGHSLFYMNETKFNELSESSWMHTPSLHVLKDKSRSLLPPPNVLHPMFPF